MARRRVQDEQGEIAGVNGTAAASAALHAQSSAAIEQIQQADLEREEKAERAARSRVYQPAPAPAPSPLSESRAPQAVETVTVTWGEELYTPVQFCSFRVGPYSAATSLRPGESREQAADRLMRELERIASKERDIKVRVYREGLEKVIPKKGSST